MAKTKGASAPPVKSPKKSQAKPTQEDIALRAYHIFLERKGAPGSPYEDWLRAEQELNAPAKKPRATKSKVISIAA